jgi:hypothetical protein
MRFDLAKFWNPLWLENQGLSLFLPKTSFSTRFDSKHRRNHDKTTYDLKKPPKKPKLIRIQKSTRAHICFFTNFKGTKTLL